MKKTSSHSKIKPDNANALTQLLFEAFETSGDQQIRVTDFLNPTTPQNRENSLFIPNGGIFHGPENKQNRGSFMKALQRHGVEVQGTTPANQYVVFPQGFQEFIPAIVADFLGNLDSVSSAKPVMSKKLELDAKTQTICSHGYPCAFNASCCPRVASGGAAAVPHSSSKSSMSPMTLAQLQEEQWQSKNTKILCVVCQFTNKNGSGSCKYKGCNCSHPFNPKSVVIKENPKTDGKNFYTARVCQDFIRGSCKNEMCEYAHLSVKEYDAAVENERIRRKSKAERSKVSSKKQPEGQKKIVPSQVRVGQPQQHTHHLGEMPMINSFCEFLADETGSEWNAFAGSNLFSELLNFESREGEQKSRQSRSYSPAVEVDSSDEESVQGDE